MAKSQFPSIGFQVKVFEGVIQLKKIKEDLSHRQTSNESSLDDVGNFSQSCKGNHSNRCKMNQERRKRTDFFNRVDQL